MIKILVVDDELPIRKWLQFCISQLEDFSCVVAQNGKEGYELFCSERPDIVLSDIEMAGLNGIEMLKEIRKQDEDAHFLILSSHSDFAYARSALKVGAIEYLLKTEMTKENLQNLLKKQKDIIMEKRLNSGNNDSAFQQLMKSLIIDSKKVEITNEKLEECNIRFSNCEYILIKTDVDFINEAKNINCDNFEIRYNFEYDKKNYVFITQKEQQNGTNQIINALREYFENSDKTCSISDTFSEMINIKDAVEQVNYRFKLKFYKEKEHVFYNGKSADFSLIEEEFSIAHTKALLEQNFGEVFECLEKFLTRVYKECPSDIDSLKKTLKTASVSFLNFTKDSLGEIETLVKQIKDEILNAKSIDELSKAIDLAYAHMKSKTNTQVFSSQIATALEFIEENYASKISLSEIAETQYYSVEHFSRLFSKEVGIPFVAYVNNLRMKHAIRLLETTSKKINEIAEEVGFTTVSYFSTMFKRKFGQNPYEYQINSQKRSIKLDE